MISTLNSWMRQPTTMLGLAMAAASLALCALGLISPAAFGCVLGPALGLMFVDDNTAFSGDLKALLIDAVTTETSGTLKSALPGLIRQSMAVIADAGVTLTAGNLSVAGNLPAAAPVAPSAASLAKVAMLLLIGLPLGLTACGETSGTATLTPTSTPSKAALACAVDGALQPFAAATLEELVPGSTTSLAMTVDTLLIHPAIVAYCNDIGGTPAAVAATPASVPVAATPAPPAAPVPAFPPTQAPLAFTPPSAATASTGPGVGPSPVLPAAVPTTP
jgi:hypothetical protein